MRYSSRSSWSMPAGSRRNTPIFRNRKLTLPLVARLPPLLVMMLRTAGHGAGRIVGRRLHQQRHAVRRVALVDHFLVVGGVAPGGALDRRLDLVLGHVDGARVLDDSPQRRVGRRIGAAGLDGHGDVLRDAGELLRHAVPPREHRVLSDFEYASHGAHGARSARRASAPTRQRAPPLAAWPRARRLAERVDYQASCALQHAHAAALRAAGWLRCRAAAAGGSTCSQCSTTARFFSSSHCSLTRAQSATAARKLSYSCAMRWRRCSICEWPRAGQRASFSWARVNCMASSARWIWNGGRALQALRQADVLRGPRSATWSDPTATSARRCDSRARRCGGSCGSPRRR